MKFLSSMQHVWMDVALWSFKISILHWILRKSSFFFYFSFSMFDLWRTFFPLTIVLWGPLSWYTHWKSYILWMTFWGSSLFGRTHEELISYLWSSLYVWQFKSLENRIVYKIFAKNQLLYGKGFHYVEILLKVFYSSIEGYLKIIYSVKGLWKLFTSVEVF